MKQSKAYRPENLHYLKMLARQYPNVQAASTEIINLQAILNLPKGTEHFVSDVHGEYEAFLHILNSASGVVREKLDDLSICSIELSNVNAGAMLAEHLYQLGHRKLVFISTPFNQLTLAREQRLEGIRKQLELHGVTDGLEVLVADRQAEADSQDDGLPYEYSVGRQLTAELIRRESMATALIGVNDMTALGILSELAAQGLRVPRDFSVCGFDNIFSSSITTPGLTTIDHHLRTRCQAAVDMVITQSTPSRIPTPFVNKIE